MYRFRRILPAVFQRIRLITTITNRYIRSHKFNKTPIPTQKGLHMYASIRDAMVLNAGYQTILEGLTDLGLTATEMDFSRGGSVRALTLPGASFQITDAAVRDNFKQHLSECGIHVSALLLANNFNATDLSSEVAWCVSAVKAAGALGIKAVRIDSAMRDQEHMDLKARIDCFTRGIEWVLEETEDTGVPLGIENHGGRGNQREFLDGVLDAVSSPRLGMTLDTGNFYWYGYPLDEVYEILEHFASKAKHTHVKNINYPESERAKQREIGWKYGEYACPIPEGDIDHSRVIGFLKDAGYEGDICIEDESLGRFPEGERKGILQRDADYLKSLIS